MNLGTDFTPFTKANSKWIIDLHVKCKTTKLLDDNIGENLGDLRMVMTLDTTPKAQSVKGKK